jgi:serine/threonine-protein kinase PknK
VNGRRPQKSKPRSAPGRRLAPPSSSPASSSHAPVSPAGALPLSLPALASSPPAPAFPARYEPVAPLGKGGGGVVWSVRDRITGRTVALKALSEGADEREMLALVREAVALSGVEGLGVPRVLRFGRLPAAGAPGQAAKGGRSYMVRELVEGESLADLLLRPGDTTVRLGAVVRAADQLTRLHRALLLHGDIKPANIIVGEGGRATLVDLGLAATWREGGATPEGLTPRYAAPELFQGAPLTVRAEVFALGATLEEVLRAGRADLPREKHEALARVIARATSEDPGSRYPSADELANAVRSAVHLPAAEEEQGGLVWPVVGLDVPTAELLAQIAALRAGGGIVVTGPRSSGRSTLLRRIAWSLGVEGRAVAWVEAASVADAAGAIEIELGHGEGFADLVALIDDADRLGEPELARLNQVREAGGRLVFVVGVEGPSRAFPGRTFEVFPMAPLAAAEAGELVRLTIPSLSDAVVSHVVARAGGWPGRIRAIVTQLERAPVVAPADVDRLLEEDGVPTTGRADIHKLLDRGHVDEAAEVLARYPNDHSPPLSIARARLSINRGDAARAIAELGRVAEVAEGDDLLLSSSWKLAAARAHLRAGDYAEAERHAAAVGARFDRQAPSADATLLAGVDPARALSAVPAPVRSIVAEAVAVMGLAQSYASRHVEAKGTLDRAVTLARAVGEPRILSLALGSLGFALQRDEQLAEAKTAYEEALRAAEEAGDAGSVATTRLNLAGIARRQGDLAAAIRHLEAAVDMGRRSGRIATLRQALLNLANLDLYLGRLAKSRVSIDALVEERGDLPPQVHAQLLGLEAEYAARSGDLLAADRLCAECAEAYHAMGRRLDEVEARIERVLFAAQRPTADVAELGRQVDLAAALLGDGAALRAQMALAEGRVAALAGREEEALAHYGESLKAARDSGQKDWIWRALEARAEVELGADQALKARRDREEALLVLEEIAARLPRDLREVYWNDARRHAVRSACLLELASSPTMTFGPPGEDRLARVLEINRAIAGEHDLRRLLEKVTDHAVALLRAERGFLLLRSGYARSAPTSPADPLSLKGEGGDASSPRSGDLSVHAARDEAGDDPHGRFSQSIAERVMKSGEPVVTTSAREDARMADYLSVHQLMLQSVACVPVRARQGAVIGALYLETRLRPSASFAEEIPTLVALADQVAIAIETARLLGENERRARALEQANAELTEAHKKLEDLLGHRTAQLVATRRDLRSARAVLRGHFGYEGLVGTSEAMRRVYALIDRVKDTDVPVLILGESGTGKEVVARAIHNAGPRAKKSFVGINCGAIPEHLLESELFGHVRGAFTGADRDRKGLFREATEGTILLDEIGEMPQKMQAGLLRVLQEKVVRPVGGQREEAVDTRVMAATHRDLSGMVEARQFREDLFYRLHVIQVRVPPLRERIEDIPLLIDHFLGIFAARYGRERRSVSRAALRKLMGHPWPGNVRQLENVLLNAWVLSDEPELAAEDISLPESRPRPAVPAPGAKMAAAAAPAAARKVETSLDAHKATERERILSALASCSWNRVKAAEMVGLPRRTFYRRLREYGIQ